MVLFVGTCSPFESVSLIVPSWVTSPFVKTVKMDYTAFPWFSLLSFPIQACSVSQNMCTVNSLYRLAAKWHYRAGFNSQSSSGVIDIHLPRALFCLLPPCRLQPQPSTDPVWAVSGWFWLRPRWLSHVMHTWVAFGRKVITMTTTVHFDQVLSMPDLEHEVYFIDNMEGGGFVGGWGKYLPVVCGTTNRWCICHFSPLLIPFQVVTLCPDPLLSLLCSHLTFASLSPHFCPVLTPVDKLHLWYITLLGGVHKMSSCPYCTL